mmetsp:Transcript_16811/g.52193  ORF Transcript_16811/g.52193 Transcript_16811/m.52193 type:complete len:223 (-) Transcript_16811:58-726(-)
MAALRLVGMQLVSPNPAPFGDAMTWRLTIDASHALPEAIDVAFGWVADVADASKDVELDELEVGPFPPGQHAIELECDAPELDDLDPDHILDETCITVALRYRGKQFLHVGFPVRVRWADPKHEEEMPDEVRTELLTREVISKRHTSTSEIDWGLAPAAGVAAAAASDSSDDDASADEEDEEEEDSDAEEQPAAAAADGVKRSRDEVDGDAAQPSKAQPAAE